MFFRGLQNFKEPKINCVLQQTEIDNDIDIEWLNIQLILYKAFDFNNEQNNDVVFNMMILNCRIN